LHRKIFSMSDLNPSRRSRKSLNSCRTIGRPFESLQTDET
jgi:hypothetical protein